MLTDLQYRILRKIAPGVPESMNASEFTGDSKLQVSLGDDLLALTKDKIVIDFGCGEGVESVHLARLGAKKVIGLDIRNSVLEKARRNAEAAGLTDRCEFTTHTDTKADVIISFDAFEHFADPAAILEIMHSLLQPGGCVMVCFGPTWYHPLGGHLFSVFPWAHLVFSEEALIRWRAHVRPDGATRFSEVDGGLNQMTISRFERLIAESKFKVDSLETVPIRKLSPLHSRLTREFTTAMIRTVLIPKA